MGDTYKAYYKSEAGVIEICGNDEGITEIGFVKDGFVPDSESANVHPSLRECYNQLDEYFKGDRKEFSVKLKLQGTEFQKQVWSELLKIPYGKTATYKDIAIAVGNPKAVRAVGGANNRNNIGIIIPCHRVVGSDGSLTGYAGGLDKKEWLLRHEGIIK